MSPDREEVPLPRVDISACLEAVNMYDAAYHRDRDNPVEVTTQEPLEVVSLWKFLWAKGNKVGTGLLGHGMSMTILFAAILIVSNIINNICEYQRAQPIVQKHLRVDTKVTRWRVGGIDNTPSETNEDDFDTWTIPSPYPLPPNWAENNLRIYETLLVVIVLSRVGSVYLLRRAKTIKTGVPLQYADTAHLPAHESLVRASQEPALETLVRASEEPSQETLMRSAMPPSDLLRSAGSGHETASEQLVRASAGGAELDR